MEKQLAVGKIHQVTEWEEEMWSRGWTSDRFKETPITNLFLYR